MLDEQTRDQKAEENMKRVDIWCKQDEGDPENCSAKLLHFNIENFPVEIAKENAQQQQNCVNYVVSTHLDLNEANRLIAKLRLLFTYVIKRFQWKIGK